MIYLIKNIFMDEIKFYQYDIFCVKPKVTTKHTKNNNYRFFSYFCPKFQVFLSVFSKFLKFQVF